MRPRRPVGQSSKARFWQWAYDSINELQPKTGQGVLTSRTTRGVFREMLGRAAQSPAAPLVEDFRLVHSLWWTGEKSRDEQPLPTLIENGLWAGFTQGEFAAGPSRWENITESPGSDFIYVKHDVIGATTHLLPQCQPRTSLFAARESGTINVSLTTTEPMLKTNGSDGIGIDGTFGPKITMFVLPATYGDLMLGASTDETQEIAGTTHYLQRGNGTVSFIGTQAVGCSSLFTGQNLLVKPRGGSNPKGLYPGNVAELSGPPVATVFRTKRPADLAESTMIEWVRPQDQPEPRSVYNARVLHVNTSVASITKSIPIPTGAIGKDFFFVISYGSHPQPNIFGEPRQSVIDLRITVT